MLEVRYNIETKKLTAWCGDPDSFGHLERQGHTVVILDIPIPTKPMEALLFDEASQNLVDNPDYVEPESTNFERLNPIMGVEHRLAHIEEWLEKK